MPTLHGEVVTMGITESWVHPVDCQVLVTQHGKAVATGTVGSDDTFEIELPARVEGEIEVTIATQGVAPALVDVDRDGDDVGVTMIYNPGGAYY